MMNTNQSKKQKAKESRLNESEIKSILRKYRNDSKVPIVSSIGVARSGMYDIGGGLFELRSFKYVEMKKSEVLQKIKQQKMFTKSGFDFPFILEIH